MLADTNSNNSCKDDDMNQEDIDKIKSLMGNKEFTQDLGIIILKKLAVSFIIGLVVGVLIGVMI